MPVKRTLAIAYTLAVAALLRGGLVYADITPVWEKPRALTEFQSLLDHSPFSLPTAEESSPLSDRYALTGIVTIDGVEQVFVFDRTDQSRELLTHTPNTKNMSLVALVREGDKPPEKATIRVGADTGTIAYMEASPQQQLQQPFMMGIPGSGMRPGLQLPSLPMRPNITGPQMPPGMNPQFRHIIRRPMITPPPPQPASP